MEEFKKLVLLDLDNLSNLKNDSDVSYVESLLNNNISSTRHIHMPASVTINHTDQKVLRENLKYLREMLANEITRYDTALWNYEDTVPAEEYESLQDEFDKKSREYTNLKNKISYLRKNFEKLVAIADKSKEEYRRIKEKYKQLNLSATPRPNWYKCARVIDGGLDRWRHLVANLSSDEIIDVLLNEFSGITDNPHLNLDEPPYFQVESGGKTQLVHNKRLNRREIALSINEVWKAKREYDQQSLNTHRQPMSEFVDFYFESKYGSIKYGFEWSINFKHSCAKYNHFEEAFFINSVLKNQVDEGIYHHFQDATQIIHDNLTKINQNESKWKQLKKGFFTNDKKTHSKNTFSISEVVKVLKNDRRFSDEAQSLESKISRKGFIKALRDSFQPHICTIDINKLIDAAYNELKLNGRENFILYNELFHETDEGRVDGFLLELKQSMNEDRLNYQKRLIDLIVENGIRNIITKDNFIYCSKEMDDTLSESQIGEFCHWIFRHNNELDYCEFLKRLENGNICNNLRYAKK